jgi:hypothetical protein
MSYRLMVLIGLCAIAGCVVEQPDTPPMPPGMTMPPPSIVHPMVEPSAEAPPRAPSPFASPPDPNGPHLVSSATPKPWKPGRFEVEPRTPCIGDVVTFKGSDLAEGTLVLRLGSPQAMDGGNTGKRPHCPPADAVDLGRHVIGPDGTLEVRLELREQMGPQLRLDPTRYYYFYFTYGADPELVRGNECFGSYLPMALCDYL